MDFVFNNYDPCVCNKMVNGKQQTVRFHVDDLLSSHDDSKVNDDFLVWLNQKYGKYGAVKATRGKVHDFLGMTLDFSTDGKFKVDMTKYVQEMLLEFPVKFGGKDAASTPAGENLFAPSTGKELSEERKKLRLNYDVV